MGRFCAEDMCVMMFGRAFSQHGEIERASRCRGIYIYVTEATVSFVRRRQPHRSPYGGIEVLWTLKRGRCWDTGRGLAERIALMRAPETLSYSDSTSALCSLTNSAI